jgi:hypothetical protein
MHLSQILLGLAAAASVVLASDPYTDPYTKSSYVKPKYWKPVEGKTCHNKIDYLSIPKGDGYSDGLTVSSKPVAVAIVVGYRSYKCSKASSSYYPVKPVFSGAVGTLYDATCLAAYKISSLDYVTKKVYYQRGYALKSYIVKTLGPNNEVGTLKYKSPTTPYYTFSIGGGYLNTATKIVKTIPAPSYAHGFPWEHQVVSYPSSKIPFKNIYVVKTLGGLRPKKCYAAGEVKVRFVAQYWFYA